MLYHVTPDGPKPCGATVGRCPYKDHHEDFESARISYELSKQTFSTKKRDRLLIPLRITPNKNKTKILESFDSLSRFYVNEQNTETAIKTQAQCRKFLETILDGKIPESIPKGAQHGLSMISYSFHSHLCDAGFYAKATKKNARALAEIIGDGVALDLMAGKGYLAKSLREAGARTIATDDNSWSLSEDIEKSDAKESLLKYGPQVTHVILAWTPLGATLDHEILMLCRERFPHITIINIGEPPFGATGSEIFWEDAHEVNSEPILYETTSATNDFVALVK